MEYYSLLNFSGVEFYLSVNPKGIVEEMVLPDGIYANNENPNYTLSYYLSKNCEILYELTEDEYNSFKKENVNWF